MPSVLGGTESAASLYAAPGLVVEYIALTSVVRGQRQLLSSAASVFVMHFHRDAQDLFTRDKHFELFRDRHDKLSRDEHS